MSYTNPSMKNKNLKLNSYFMKKNLFFRLSHGYKDDFHARLCNPFLKYRSVPERVGLHGRSTLSRLSPIVISKGSTVSRINTLLSFYTTRKYVRF